MRAGRSKASWVGGDASDSTLIKTRRDYSRAVTEIEGLTDTKRNTPAADRLDMLVTLVEAWEAKHFPLDLPDAVEAMADACDLG